MGSDKRILILLGGIIIFLPIVYIVVHKFLTKQIEKGKIFKKNILSSKIWKCIRFFNLYFSQSLYKRVLFLLTGYSLGNNLHNSNEDYRAFGYRCL